jgi:preprotein translocase subunit SecD
VTENSGPAPRRSLAAPIVIGIASLVAVALIVGGVLFVRSQLGEGGEPLGTIVAEVVVEVEDASGAPLEAGDLEVARQIVLARLDRAGIHPVAVSISGTQVIVRIGQGVADPEVERAREILTWPATVEFREVLAVDLEVEVGDCAAQPDLRPEEEVTLCDRERSAVYLLGAAELDGTSIRSVVVSDAPSGSATSTSAVTITFDDDGAETFEQLTGRLAASGGQVALVTANEVVSAPTVMAAISGGEVQISGNFDRAAAEELARELDLAHHGLTFTVLSVELYD